MKISGYDKAKKENTMDEQEEMVLNGEQCSWCGVMFDGEHGYPVVCRDCWKDAKTSERKGVQKATLREL